MQEMHDTAARHSGKVSQACIACNCTVLYCTYSKDNLKTAKQRCMAEAVNKLPKL